MKINYLYCISISIVLQRLKETFYVFMTVNEMAE